MLASATGGGVWFQPSELIDPLDGGKVAVLRPDGEHPWSTPEA